MAKKLQLTGFPRFSSPLTYGVSVLLNQIINVTDDDAAKLLALTAQNPVTNVVGPIWTLYVGAEPATYDLTTESNDKNFLDGSLMILPAQLALMTNKPPRGTLLRGRDNIPYGYSDGVGGYVPNGQSLVVAGSSLASPMIVGKLGSLYTRNSVNSAADATFETAFSFVVPGGSIGRSGRLLMSYEVEFTAPELSATNHIFATRVGSVDLHPQYSNTTAGQIGANMNFIMYADFSETAQRYRTSIVKDGGHPGIPTGTLWVTTAVDFSVDQTVNFECRWSAATSGETLRLRNFTAFAEYGA